MSVSQTRDHNTSLSPPTAHSVLVLSPLCSQSCYSPYAMTVSSSTFIKMTEHGHTHKTAEMFAALSYLFLVIAVTYLLLNHPNRDVIIDTLNCGILCC